MVDFVSHVLWGYVCFHSFTDWPLYVFFGLLPDLIFSVPSVFTMLKYRRTLKWRLPHEEASKIPEFVLVRKTYWTAHSLLLIALLVVAAAVLAPAAAAPVAGGMLLHFALDVFTHKDGMAGQKPLYPLSQFKVVGATHWSNRRFLLVDYALLAGALVLMALKII